MSCLVWPCVVFLRLPWIALSCHVVFVFFCIALLCLALLHPAVSRLVLSCIVCLVLYCFVLSPSVPVKVQAEQQKGSARIPSAAQTGSELAAARVRERPASRQRQAESKTPQGVVKIQAEQKGGPS